MLTPRCVADGPAGCQPQHPVRRGVLRQTGRRAAVHAPRSAIATELRLTGAAWGTEAGATSGTRNRLRCAATAPRGSKHTVSAQAGWPQPRTLTRERLAVIAAQQLNPVRHGNQIPGLDTEAGVRMDECAGSQNATVMAIATEGWRAARKQWPDNFVGGKMLMLSRSVALSVSLRVTWTASPLLQRGGLAAVRMRCSSSSCSTGPLTSP